MAFPASSEETDSRRGRTALVPAPIVVLAISLLATALMAIVVWNNAAQKDRERFDNILQRTRSQIDVRIDLYLSMLRAGRGLLAAQPNVNRAEFHEFVEQFQIEARYPGVQGIGFTRRVRPEEKEQFIAQMRGPVDEGGLGIADFHIWPVQERGEYHAITFLEPLDRRNMAAIGFDMFTEPNRQDAMVRACETGKAAATAKVTLVQEIDFVKQPGFLIYLPVYKGNAIPATIEQRRADLVGFVYSPFRAEDLFTKIFGDETRPRIEFEVYDGTAISHDSLLRAGGMNYDPEHAAFTAVETMNIAGRPWTIAYATRPEFDEGSTYWYGWLVLIVGGCISVVLFAITMAQSRALNQLQVAQASLRKAEQERAQHAREIARALDQRSFELTQIHERLRRTESMAMLGSLSAGIAHDLGNLVLPMRMRLDMLKSMELTNEQRDMVEAVARNVGYVNDLATRLRQSMKKTNGDSDAGVGTGEPVVASRLIDLAEWRKENQHFLENVITPPHRLAFDIARGLPKVNVDPVGMTQAVYNLVQNAEKAMRTSGVGTTITIAATQDDDMLELWVMDDGPGLPDEIVQRCVELGFMTDRHSTNARRSSAIFSKGETNGGLGLALVKAFVESAGGQIVVHTGKASAYPAGKETSTGRSGRGSQISIRLPIERESANDLQSDEPMPSSLSQAQMDVVCVDDFGDLLHLVETMVNHQADMRCVNTFMEAGALLDWLSERRASERPDVIVFDWAMPGMRVTDAMEHVASHWPEIRMYVFTSHPRHLVADEAMQAGAVEVIEKSEGVHTLLRAIRDSFDHSETGAVAAFL